MDAQLNAQELESSLQQFHGTEKYYRYQVLLLTDDARFLAEKAGAYWLMDLIWSYAGCEWFKKEAFMVCKINVKDNRAMVAIEDGNDNVYMEQFLEFTDFPLPEFKLYVARSAGAYVVMLPGEY